MKKHIADEVATKAKKREIKKRPRMRMHGRNLKIQTAHAGKTISQR